MRIPAILHFSATLAVLACALPGRTTAQSPAPASAATPRTLLDGVFTDAQASRGRTTYAAHCGSCHSTSEFSRAGFLAGWRGQSVFALHVHIRDLMPFDNPGSLSPEQYTDVLTYIFSLHALPGGAQELPPDSAAQAAVLIETREPEK